MCGYFWEYFIIFKERAAAFEKKLRKNVRLLLKENLQLLLMAV